VLLDTTGRVLARLDDSAEAATAPTVQPECASVHAAVR